MDSHRRFGLLIALSLTVSRVGLADDPPPIVLQPPVEVLEAPPPIESPDVRQVVPTPGIQLPEVSDTAVFNALRWLKAQQRADGSWSFDHVGRGAEPGEIKNSPTGATGLALLAFLGAGQTHIAGEYRQTVYDGLLYLVKQADSKDGAADFGTGDGRMRTLSHAWATLALCETHALTWSRFPEADQDVDGPRQRRLRALLTLFSHKNRDAAQLGVNFLLKHQAETGGWRSLPDNGPDVDATVAAVLALHSARLAGLEVPAEALGKTEQFLDSLAIDDGRRYRHSAKGEATDRSTAAGLLCRKLLDPKAAAILQDEMDPSAADPVGRLLGTHLLHLHGGGAWETWNRKLRSQVVMAQRTTGAASGSWPATGDDAEAGGDLMQTCLSILTLEVYYRHLPIYRRAAK